MSLPTIKLGNDSIPAIAWGAMGLSSFYGTIPANEDRFKLLDALHATGLRNWDTANCYGDSEDLLGQWFKRTGKRADIFLATKCGFIMEPDAPARIDGSPANIKAAIASSLARLGTDHVDLYYLHRPDPAVPIETSVRALAELVTEGKVRYIGLSDVNGATLRRACAVAPIAAVQVEYSPFELVTESPEVGLVEAARELGVTIFAYSPLGRGMLSGRYKSPDDFEPTDARRHFPRFSKENFPNVLKLVDGLRAIGARHGATAGQVALAWLIGQGVVPVFGASRIQSAEDNVGALGVTLSDAELREVREVAEKAEASHGPRYPAFMTVQSFVDTPPL